MCENMTSTYLPACRLCLSAFLACLLVCMSACLPACLQLSACLPTYLRTYVATYLRTYLRTYLPTYLPTDPPTCIKQQSGSVNPSTFKYVENASNMDILYSLVLLRLGIRHIPAS